MEEMLIDQGGVLAQGLRAQGLQEEDEQVALEFVAQQRRQGPRLGARQQARAGCCILPGADRAHRLPELVGVAGLGGREFLGVFWGPTACVPLLRSRAASAHVLGGPGGLFVAVVHLCEEKK